MCFRCDDADAGTYGLPFVTLEFGVDDNELGVEL